MAPGTLVPALAVWPCLPRQGSRRVLGTLAWGWCTPGRRMPGTDTPRGSAADSSRPQDQKLGKRPVAPSSRND